jgi:hypothetical protein
MKNTLNTVIKKSNWEYLKKGVFTPNKTSIVLNDDDNEYRYTKKDTIITKQLLSRHIDIEPEYLSDFISPIDKKAFQYFVDLDRENIDKIKSSFTNFKNTKTGLVNKLAFGFATIIQRKTQEKKDEKLNINSELNVFTTTNEEKIVKGLSVHKNHIEINEFKDITNPLYARMQKSEFKSIEIPKNSHIIEIRDNSQMTTKDYDLQYTLFKIDRDFYRAIDLDIKIVSHNTGILEIDKEGNPIIEQSKCDKTRPKTGYTPKEDQVSAEGYKGITASLNFITKKTQVSNESKDSEVFDLIFIPKNHPSINIVSNVMESMSKIRDLSELSQEDLDLILNKHFTSKEEVVMHLFEEIDKNDTSNGVFIIKEGSFVKNNPKICEFIINSGFIDKDTSYHLTIDKEVDIHNEPIIYVDKASYNPAELFEIKSSGDLDHSDGDIT